MAIAEQEVKQEAVKEAVREIRVPISREQEEALARAASQAGQSLEEFAASVLTHAAEAAADTQTPSAAESFAADRQWHQFMQGTKAERLNKIIGIFQDEPLLDSLMERIHEDQQRGIEEFKREAERDAEAEG